MSRNLLKMIMVTAMLLCLADGSIASGADPDTGIVEQTLGKYFEAFNRHDAASAVGEWVRDGEYLSPGGEKIKGSDKLKKRLDSFFKQHPSVKVSLLNKPTILILSKDKAVARGVARTEVADKTASDSEYTATFSKGKDTWKISSMEDHRISSFDSYIKLSELAWLLGKWSDESGADLVETEWEWGPNKSFIEGRFSLKSSDEIAFEGRQIIAWDPVTKVIRSWVFDSEGGIGRGVWSKDGSGWSVNISTSLADGRKASAINTYRPDGPDRITWRSTGREIAGSPLPNLPETTVIRNVEQKDKQDKK